MWLLRRTHRLHSWKLVMRLQLRVLSGIVMKRSYTDGEWDQCPHQHTSSSFGFFFFPTGFPKRWPGAHLVEFIHETSRNVIRGFLAVEADVKLHQFLDVRGLSHGPRSWLRGCCCLDVMGSWEGSVQCCLWPQESTVQEQTSFWSSLIGRNVNRMARTAVWTKPWKALAFPQWVTWP